MKKKYDYIVYLGRFQIFHKGHIVTLDQALELAKEVIIVVGSANSPSTVINPFDAEDRIHMIGDVVGDMCDRIHFITVEDRLYNMNKWIGYVQAQVSKITKNGTVALIGHDKGDNKYTLDNLFPNWTFEDTGPYVSTDGEVLSASKIRKLLFEGNLEYTTNYIPNSVYNYLKKFVDTPSFTNLQGEYNNILEEERIVNLTPNGMTFVTTDSVVVQSGHILLVQRGEYPGKWLWALPGVHVGHNETVEQASIRALTEETRLKVPNKVLEGSMQENKLFDHPQRSLRGRLTQERARSMTIAYYYELDSSKPLPNARGGKRINKAWWFTFAEVRTMRNRLFEDHADIIDYFIG